MLKNEATCWDCELDFEYSDDDVFTACDIIEGQYTEWDDVTCPHCGVSNQLPGW